MFDTGPVAIFCLLVLATLVYAPYVVYQSVRGGGDRRRMVIRLSVLLAFMILSGLGVYKIDMNESLYSAANSGNLQEVKRLLGRGASPDATWESGETAIEAARKNGRQDIVALLQKAGAKD